MQGHLQKYISHCAGANHTTQPHFCIPKVTHFIVLDGGVCGGGPYLLGESSMEVFLLYKCMRLGVSKSLYFLFFFRLLFSTKTVPATNTKLQVLRSRKKKHKVQKTKNLSDAKKKYYVENDVFDFLLVVNKIQCNRVYEKILRGNLPTSQGSKLDKDTTSD